MGLRYVHHDFIFICLAQVSTHHEHDQGGNIAAILSKFSLE
jgi:hypothetical protein